MSHGNMKYIHLLKRFQNKSLPAKSMLGRVFIMDMLNEDVEDGGPGSGNWGHRGRPGQVGGSGKGGGAQYRGGRSDIKYHSSKHDWLNGLSGENQHQVVSWLKGKQEQYPIDPNNKKPIEQRIMENGSETDKINLLHHMSQARKLDAYHDRLKNENLDEKERKLIETLGNKYGIDPKTNLPDDFDTSVWKKEDRDCWYDLKSKMLGGPTSGKEAPDELQYEAGLKERPKPAGPDLSWFDRPRSWNSSQMESYMQATLNEGYKNINTKEEFAALNQRFLDKLKYEKPGTAAETAYGLRAMRNLRNAMHPDGYTLKKEDINRLSDNEKERFLEVVNQFYPSYRKIESIKDIDDGVIAQTERAMDLTPLRKNDDKKAINDYVLMQEKILGGFEPTPKDKFEAAKMEKERAATELANAKAAAERSAYEQKVAAWKSTHPPEVIEKMYHPDSVAGVKRNASGNMTHSEADSGRANTLHDAAHRINCQTCVFAYEMRMRGYNVQAKGRDKKNDWQSNLARNQNNGWINPETGEPPEMITPEGKRITDKTATKWLDSVVGHNGERYTFSYCHRTGAHVVSLYRDSAGKLTIYDPQRDPKTELTTFTGSSLETYLSGRVIWNRASGSNWRPKIMRIDNALPKQEYYDNVLEAGS